MRIKRIDQIRNYRVFRDFKWPSSLEDFGRFNLIYGWNGTGKTAISTIFRSAQLHQAVAEGDVRLRIDEQLVPGSQFATATIPHVRVFNRDSVHKNVFEFPAQELPAVYVLGEDSVEKQREIEGFKKELSKKAAEGIRAEKSNYSEEQAYENHCADRAREIKNLLTTAGGGAYNTYDKSRYKSAARRIGDANPQSPRLTEGERQRCLEIKASSPMAQVALVVALGEMDAISKRVDELLAREIASKAIDFLVSNPPIAKWVGDGLSLHSDHPSSATTCLFCAGDLRQERIAELRAHFDRQFTDFQNELSGAHFEVQKMLANLKSIQLPQPGLLYGHLVNEYRAAVDRFHQQLMYLQKYLVAMSAALSAKMAQPFRKMNLMSFLATGSEAIPEGGWETFFHILVSGITKIGATSGGSALAQVNSIIGRHNAHTVNFNAEVVRAREALEQDEIVASLEGYRKRRFARDQAGKRVNEIKAALREIENKIHQLEMSIKQHQTPADELNREMAAYLGRDELRFSVRQTGYVIYRGQEPAFNLSEGEKTAIAFMYFLKSLRDTGFDAQKGVVVVDDPISSLDSNSLYSAFGFMKARTADVGQLFVLTHNFLFFRQVRNWFSSLRGKDKREARFYQLSCRFDAEGVRTSAISALDPLLRDYESEYHYVFKRVYEEAYRQPVAEALTAHYELPNLGRRLLEGFLAFRAPGLAGHPYSQLEALNVEPARKARLMRFLDTYSHNEQIGSEGQDFAYLAEVPSVLREMLDLMREKDPGHYESMRKAIQSQAAALA